LVLWLWGLFACTSAALAQGNDAAADEEGRGFFIAGRASYLAGRYDEALERFERSYEKSGRPELLYNIGTAAERAGKLARALDAYRQFLDKQPESERRVEVETHIADLETRVADEPSEPAALSTAQVRPLDTTVTPTSESKSVLAPGLILAASGALLATGVVLVVLGYKAEQRVHDAPDGARWSDYRNDAQHALAFRGAGFSVGAVGVVGAVLSGWWLASARKDARSGTPVAGLGYVGWRGSF
jgi:tetratricopeptide (TPR) repeat protein